MYNFQTGILATSSVSPATIDLLLFFVILALILVYVFVGRGLFLIKANQVGVLTKKFGGQRMPPGQIIARQGQIGIQAGTLQPGLYWRIPLFWSVRKFDITEIGSDQVGTIEAIDGEPLLPGRFTGDEVECNRFQDGEGFLANHGRKGQQVGVLTPGSYRINPLLFKVVIKATIVIDANSTGIVIAQDGIPLPSNYIIAPQCNESASDRFPMARGHKHFQDGQAFIDSGGYRGPQLDTLQPGKYFINDLLFKVTVLPKYEVEPGFVAVLRSNVGPELHKPNATPALVPLFDERTGRELISGDSQNHVVGADTGERISSDVETVLIEDMTERGIYETPLAPGTYNLNTIAYTAYAVPTSAIMIDWADSSKINAPTMAGPAVTTRTRTTAADSVANPADYAYTTDLSTKGVSYFNFSQLEVITKDGFLLEVGVRMVIRIRQENAAFVIARFGTVFNLIQQIVHPLIDSSFRNDAGDKEALNFFQTRTDLQKYVFENARENFGKYHVEAQALLISFIRPSNEQGEALLNTQNLKQIALQQQSQFQEQAKAEQQRIAVQEQTARANMQPQVVNAILQIDIERNKAEAVRRQSEGLRDYQKNLADGEATAIRNVGEAQADAYHAQADVLGGDKIALIKSLDEIKNSSTRLVPETVVMSGASGQDIGSMMFTGWLASMMNKPSPAIAPYQKMDEGSQATPPTNNSEESQPTDFSLPDASSMTSSISSIRNQSAVSGKLPGAIDAKKVVPISAPQTSENKESSSSIQNTIPTNQMASFTSAGRVTDQSTDQNKPQPKPKS